LPELIRAPIAAVDNGRVRRVSSPTFVGRAEQLASFDRSLAGAAEGEPAVLLVAGESGVGKTRLVTEFAERARAAAARVAVGDCVELGEGELPYAPVVGALRDLGPEAIELAGPGRVELARLLPEAGDPAAAERDDEFAQARLFETLLTLLGRVGEQAPLVLVIEDLHWADRSTRDFLSFLLRATRRERLVIVATYRSDELHRRHPLRPFLANAERLERVQRLEVAPFSRLELSAQLLGILGAHPDTAVAEALFERSGGNPFFAEELLAATADGNGHALPETLRDALMVRVETLSQETQQLLRVIAAAGRSVTHGLLASVTSLDEAHLIASLREAVTHYVLVQRSGDDGYAFRHALMREAVYEDLLPGERGDLHVRLAEALESNPELSADSVGPAGELSWHWHQAHELPHALGASIEASIQAERMHAPADAARHVDNAIELWDRVANPERSSGTTLVALLRRGAQLNYHAGELDRAVGLGRRVAELIGEDDVVAAVLARERLGRYLWTSGHHAESVEVYKEAVRLMPAQPPTSERAFVLAGLAQVRMLIGHTEDSLALAEEALEIARAVGDRPTESHALNTLGVDIGALGDRARGIAALRESLEIVREHDASAEDLHRAYTNLGDMLDQDGQIEEGIAMALEGFESARESGVTRTWAGFLLTEAAKRYGRLGQLQEADRLVREALDYGGEGVSGGNVQLTAVELDVMLGRWDEARVHQSEARRLLSRAAGSMWVSPLYGAAALLAEHDGDVAAVRRAVSEAQERMAGEDEYPFYARDLYLPALRAEADAAERARAARDPEGEREARESGAAVAERMRGLSSAAHGSLPPQLVADGATIDAELARLHGRPDPALWEAAAEANEKLRNGVDAGYARLRKAEALLEGGAGRDEVTDALRAAHGLADESGAVVLRERCELLSRRARIPLSDEPAPPASADDPFGLTPREREVLALVAAGRTNRQIGEELFMSEKTASVHVSRILAKLDVSTRGEAGAVAHRLGLE
jgi:DNA-binding CsgD family transcriptional regulator/tetratricopeptide (TPR) repeat protein